MQTRQPGRLGLDDKSVRLLRKYNKKLADIPLASLLENDLRFAEFSRQLDGVLLDFSRVHMDRQVLDALVELARDSGLDDARERLFSGERVNWTERRPAMHMAMRSAGLARDAGLEDAAEAERSMDRMLALAAELHAGRLPGETGAAIRDIVHIGIGGSLLGTRLLYEALGRGAATAPRVHFLGSVDAHVREALLPTLDPAATAVMVVSKSFTTADTLMHARRLRDWLKTDLGGRDARRRTFAITENVERAAGAGYPEGQVMYLPAWVGGRYSLWSPVSLSAAAAMGPDAFRELLAGARDMDLHFRAAPLEGNLPALMGLVGVWHRSIRGHGAWAVIPYDQRLRSLPAHLQQVIMESNGKSVTASGGPVAFGTAPVIFGESGTDAQHSVFQALHQGSDIVPVNFVGVIRPHHDDEDAHDELLANLLAQATALAVGRSEAETRQQLEAAGGVDETLLPHRLFHGDRPSEILMLDELTPFSLGRLLALYEHKVYVESVLWGINAFDQWGVELGKTLAPDIRSGLRSGATSGAGPEELLSYIRARR